MSRAGFVLVLLCGCRANFDEHAPADAPPDTAPATCAETALPVPASGTIGGTLAAGDGTAGSCGGDGVAELLYVIDVPAGASMIAAADGPGSQVNDLIYVRTDCADPTSEIVCDRDSGAGDQSQWRFTSPLGAGRYYVFVDGQDGDVGDVDGQIVLQLPPGATCTGNTTRDRCGPELTCIGNTCQPAGCTVVETFTTTGTFTRMATTMGDSLHAGTCAQANDGGARAPEVVYRVTLATGVSNLHVSTDSTMTTYDTLIYVRSGCTGAELGCDDDSGVQDLTSVVDTGPLPAGDYFVFIDGFSVRSGTASITITISP